MKHLTDEVSSRWAAYECLADEAIKGGGSLRTRCSLLAGAAEMLDELITAQLPALKPDKARKMRAKAVKQLRRQETALQERILPALEKKGVCLLPWQRLTDKQRELAAKAVPDELFTPLQPMTPEALAELPSGSVLRVTGDGLAEPWMLQTLKPDQTRLLLLHQGKDQLYIPIETLDDETDCSTYRLLRSSEAAWPVKRDRPMAQPAACLLICGPHAQEEATANVRRMLGLVPERVVQAEFSCDVGGWLHSLLRQETLPDILQPEAKPVVPEPLKKKHCLKAALQDKHWLLIHPADSAKPLLSLVQEAAADEQAASITAVASCLMPDSPLTDALCTAAANGKQVTVILEQHEPRLQRHAETAKRLLQAGCTVKEPALQDAWLRMDVLYIRYRDEQCCAALSTGAYDALIDRQQHGVSDLMHLARTDEMAADLEQVFAFLGGETDVPDCTALQVTPCGTRQEWLRLIRREMSHALRKQPCGLRAAMSALTDPVLIDALYDASQAGVPISLAVQGACRLQPGVPGCSERITVQVGYDGPAIHGCMLACINGGQAERYLSTTDWTPEGLDHQLGLMWRVQPVENEDRLQNWLDDRLNEQKASWKLHVDEYTPLHKAEDEPAAGE